MEAKKNREGYKFVFKVSVKKIVARHGAFYFSIIKR